MIVRKYELNNDSTTYVEFWVKENQISVMVSNSGETSITQIDYKDAEDLRNWLYDAIKQIEPAKKSNG